MQRLIALLQCRVDDLDKRIATMAEGRMLNLNKGNIICWVEEYKYNNEVG